MTSLHLLTWCDSPVVYMTFFPISILWWPRLFILPSIIKILIEIPRQLMPNSDRIRGGGNRQSNRTWLACRILALTRQIAFVELDYRLCNGRERFHIVYCDPSVPNMQLALGFLENGSWGPYHFASVHANLVTCQNKKKAIGKHIGIGALTGNKATKKMRVGNDRVPFSK